jgi:large subunit ribosomal protein L10
VKTDFAMYRFARWIAYLVRTSTPRAGSGAGGQAFQYRHARISWGDASGASSGTMGATRRSCLGTQFKATTANRRELAVERAAKKEAVEQLNEVFKTTSVAIVAHYSGLTVTQMQTLRRQMKQAGASVKVSKNRLAKIALEGTDVVAIGSLLKGPTVIATSNDPVAAPKVAVEFAKANEQFVILGGSMGKTVLNVDGVKALASLPSLDELRAKLVGLINAPATKIAQLTTAPAAKVARVVQAYASKSEAA